MSRSGYSEDYDYDDPLAMGRYRAAVDSATRGKRGQALLRELRNAMDAMTDKRLYPGSFVQQGGGCCALGAVALSRGMDVSDLEPQPGRYDEYGDDEGVDAKAVGERFDIAESMAREIMYVNDECYVGRYLGAQGPAEDEDCARWRYVRKWVGQRLKAGL